jgi:hypothetical protein
MVPARTHHSWPLGSGAALSRSSAKNADEGIAGAEGLENLVAVNRGIYYSTDPPAAFFFAKHPRFCSPQNLSLIRSFIRVSIPSLF